MCAVFWKDGCIFEASSKRVIHKAIRERRAYEGPIPYRFSAPYPVSEWVNPRDYDREVQHG